ncbi:hypothetical protein I5485_13535, partial [Citrobacter farmeri]|uniref:hypothetical protein n=1 Tax=Citrobacter farmeri TaxID=67824 RepID=UPI001903C772
MVTLVKVNVTDIHHRQRVKLCRHQMCRDIRKLQPAAASFRQLSGPQVVFQTLHVRILLRGEGYLTVLPEFVGKAGIRLITPVALNAQQRCKAAGFVERVNFPVTGLRQYQPVAVPPVARGVALVMASDCFADAPSVRVVLIAGLCDRAC